MKHMIKIILIKFAEILIGFAGGLAVGGGFIAFLTMLGIIPRLIKLSKAHAFLNVYSACVILGSLFGTFLSFTSIHWNQSFLLLMIWGIFHGIFNGMLAAGLAEVLNVFPIITRRIGMGTYTLNLLMALVFGNIAGSLFQWIIFVK